MNLIIKGHNIEITAAINEYVKNKFHKIIF